MRKSKQYYSLREAAQILGKSASWLYQLKDRGDLKVIQIGAQYVVTAQELARYRKNHRKGAH